MTPTLAELRTWFDEFNQSVFDNRLPYLRLKLTNNRRQLGQFHWGGNEGLCIKISTYWNYPTINEVRNVLLHEMCHYYCWWRGFKEEHHGKNWKAVARMATIKTGLQITRLADIRGWNVAEKNEGREAVRKEKMEAPAIIVDLAWDGYHFLIKTTKNVLKSEDTTDMDWKLRTSAKSAKVYISDNNKFKGYQTSRSIHRGYRYLDWEYERTIKPILDKSIEVTDLRALCLGDYDFLGIIR